MNLQIDEAKVKHTLSERLKNGLAGGGFFNVQMDVTLSALFIPTINADIAVFDVDGRPIAVFEVKVFPQAWTLRRQMDISHSRALVFHDVRYSVLTDGDVFLMRSQDSSEYLKTDFDKVLETIKEGLPILGDLPTTDQISRVIMDVATKVGLKQSGAIRSFIDKPRVRDLFKLDSKTGKIEFSTTSAEDAFFTHLLNGHIPTKLCRFTTRHNLFLLLKDGKQNMCSIVCMNDKSEETYADKKAGLDESWDDEYFENNNCFILSLMPQDKSDDLTMWRLYGDDAKGVCLNYEIEKNREDVSCEATFLSPVLVMGRVRKNIENLNFYKV